jgi:hypothetical protein
MARQHAGPGVGLWVEGSGCLDLLVTFGSSQIAIAIIHTQKQTIVNNVTASAAIGRELCRSRLASLGGKRVLRSSLDDTLRF